MKKNCLYKANAWAFERKKIHRQWISDTIIKYQKSLLDSHGKLKKSFSFTSLSGSNLEEYRWYRDNNPFFTPKQYVAIDRQEINLDKAKEYGIPESNIYIGEMEHVLRSIRVSKKIAIINADYTCTMQTCIEDMLPAMIQTMKNCKKKCGECFMFINSVEEILHSKKIATMGQKILNYICNDLINDFFPELDYVPITKEMIIYNGCRADTVMLSFCIHLFN